jgi:hypothetical protein
MVIWFMVYAYIDGKVERLNEFTDKTYNVSNDFTANIKNFQSFLLTGYKDKEFYINHNQKDIDLTCYINKYIHSYILKMHFKSIHRVYH